MPVLLRTTRILPANRRKQIAPVGNNKQMVIFKMIKNKEEIFKKNSSIDSVRRNSIAKSFSIFLKDNYLINKIRSNRRLIEPLRRTYRSGIYFYASFFYRKSSWTPLIRLHDYVKITQCKHTKIFEPRIIHSPRPHIYPINKGLPIPSPHEYYRFPSIYFAKIDNAEVHGATNIITSNGIAIFHDLYNFDKDDTLEEKSYRHVINIKKKKIFMRCKDNEKKHIPFAASFLDSCAHNYAHWLTEVLPRIATFCAIKGHDNIPLIIDEGLHPNIIESLSLVAGPDREIITLSAGKSIQVGVLYVTSVTGYTPFEKRNLKIRNHSHGLFSPDAFMALRKKIHQESAGWPIKDWPKKIYLRRNSQIRKLLNSAEIEDALSKKGYSAIDPETLNFSQQVQLFSQVESVVSPTGAAVANIIFCRPEIKISILVAENPHSSYWYWQNIAAAIGAKVRFVLGETEPNSAEDIHSNFYVRVEDVLHDGP